MKFNWKRFVLATAACWLLLLSCACTAAWVSEVQGLLPEIQAGISVIVGLIAALGGKVSTTVQTDITSVESAVNNELTQVGAFIAEFEKNTDTTLIGKIKAALQSVSDNLTGFISGLTGVSAPIQSKLSTLASVLISAVLAVIAVIPAVSVLASSNTDQLKALDASATSHVKNVRLTMKAAFNTALDTPSGDPDLDAVMAKAPRL